MTDNMLTWNVRNWITVVLMFLLGWFVVMTGARLLGGSKFGQQMGIGNYQPLSQQLTATG